jgi:hypothetical protein
MVLLAIAIVGLKHWESHAEVDIIALFGLVTKMFELRASGTELGLLSYVTIALTIDAIVLFILYLYSFARPVPGLMLIVIVSVVDCILLFDPVVLVKPWAILAVLVVKIVVMLLLMAGYKSAKIMETLS